MLGDPEILNKNFINRCQKSHFKLTRNYKNTRRNEMKCNLTIKSYSRGQNSAKSIHYFTLLLFSKLSNYKTDIVYIYI